MVKNWADLINGTTLDCGVREGRELLVLFQMC